MILERSDETGITRSVALTQAHAIKGLGGVGKTQIAIEYAYRYRNHYSCILWVNAANQETLTTSFEAIIKLFPLFSIENEANERKPSEAVKRWLEQCEKRWLLIFDNADDLSLIHDSIPQDEKGSILITTRANASGSLGAVSIEVENMGLIEGTKLLLHRAQRKSASAEEQDEATNVAIVLDCFPLALDQAGAYIEETGCSFVGYREVYQDHHKELLARRGEPATNYPDSVATTWSLSFQKVEQANPAATELLRFCAFLAPDAIPEELIRNSSSNWGSLLQPVTVDQFAFDQAIADLLKFSLVKRHIDKKILSIHRLVL